MLDLPNSFTLNCLVRHALTWMVSVIACSHLDGVCDCNALQALQEQEQQRLQVFKASSKAPAPASPRQQLCTGVRCVNESARA